MTKSLILLTLCTSLTVLAQPPQGGRMGPGAGRRPMGTGAGLGRTVTGAPFSAVEVRENTQTLANGNVITHKTETTIYRDSMGRVRTETTVTPRQGAGQTGTETPHTIVTIHDPVAHITLELNSATKVAHEMRMPAQRGRGGAGATAAVRTAAANPNAVKEELAMQTVNGVQASGTRVTRTTPAGARGNAQALQSVHETWISPDLKMAVMTKDTDPRTGTRITQLTNITRSEPDAALFAAPSDYKVVKAGRGGRGAR
jgi:hypothetical protein